MKKGSERFVYELEGNERTADGLRMIDVESECMYTWSQLIAKKIYNYAIITDLDASKFCNPDFLDTMKKTALESSHNTVCT